MNKKSLRSPHTNGMLPNVGEVWTVYCIWNLHLRTPSPRLQHLIPLAHTSLSQGVHVGSVHMYNNTTVIQSTMPWAPSSYWGGMKQES